LRVFERILADVNTDGVVDHADITLLIASEHPLPAWSALIAGRGLPTWSPEELPSDGVVLFDGAQTRHLRSQTRGEVRARPGQLTVGPIDWARALQDIQAVRFVGFRVHQQVGEP